MQDLDSLQGRALTREEAQLATELLWEQVAQEIKTERASLLEDGLIVVDGVELKFSFVVFGEPVEGKRSLYISLHGGGGTAPEVNDKQWENQKKLYQPAEGIYLAPRAPSNDWDLWHKPQIDPLFDYLISSLVVLADVDPNRVYLLGYSAGGDGVYQLAPRMADRWAAAGMMAGHPNDAKPYGLRNLGFTLHMGGQDTAYRRNEVAQEWQDWLAQLQAEDPEGYEHWVEIYPQHGHWMEGEDASALPWMAQFKRNPYPRRVVWWQDDVTHTRFYWLAVPPEEAKEGAKVVASVQGQTITIEESAVSQLKIRLHDDLVDLDQPIQVVYQERVLFSGTVERTTEAIACSLEERQDPKAVFYVEVAVEL